MEPLKEENYSEDGVRPSKNFDTSDIESKDSGHTPVSSTTSDKDFTQQVTNAITDGNLKTKSEKRDDSVATLETKKECGSCGGADCGCAFCDDIYAISSMNKLDLTDLSCSMEVLVDNEPDLVGYNKQLGNSNIDLDDITETAQDIEQNLDDGITSCEATVVGEHNMDENVESLENRMYNLFDSVVSDKVCEEEIDSNFPLIIENEQERKDNGETFKDKESILNEIIEFLEKEDHNTERFENIDDQNASLSARSEEAVKEDSRMSNKGVEKDSQICVEKSLIEGWNSASSATEGVQLGPSNDRTPQILECPLSVRHDISTGNEFGCCGVENTSGSNSDHQENDLLVKLHAQSSSLDPLEEDKKLVIPQKEISVVGDYPEGSEMSYSSQLDQAFPMASEASHGDVEFENTVQNADRNLFHSSAKKCSICGKVCLGQARMVSHMRVHSGVKPFDCTVCGLSFKHQENLKRHQNLHKSSKQRNTTSPNYKQSHKTLDQRKTEYLDIHGAFQSSVVKSRDKVMYMPQTEGIKGSLVSKDNFTDTNVCKETENSASVKEYVNSCRFLKEDERKIIPSVDKVLSSEKSEQSTVEIFACSVVLDKINLQEHNIEVYHHSKEKLPTIMTPVQIHRPLGLPINSKANADKERLTECVEKNKPRGEGVFKCPLCIKSYSHKWSLNKHKRHVHPDHWHQETVLSMTSEKKIFMCKYKCDKCSFRFFSTAGLIRHQNRFCSMKLNEDKEGKKMIPSQSNQNVRGKEANVLDYECSQLRPLGHNVLSISEVERGYVYEKTHICRFCGRTFSRRINLCQHEQMHIRKKLIVVKLEAEQEPFTSTVQTDHSPENSDKVSSDASKQHKCKYCGRMFSRRINLIQHEQVHKRRKQAEMVPDKVYTMESCDEKRSGGPGKNTFKTYSVQINHKCRFCSRKFFRRCNLCQHERVCHSRQIGQKQKHKSCKRTNTHNSKSKKVSVSTVENPLRVISSSTSNSCSYCRKIFTTKSNLTRHVKLHKQKKRFFKQKNKSKRTDDSLYTKKKLSESIRNRARIISTDNLHQCQLCGKGFAQKPDLSQHLKLHSQKCTQLEQVNTMNSFRSVKSNLHTDYSESDQKVNTSELVKNIKKEDINLTPHICRFCGRFFARRINLCQHERVCQSRQIVHKRKSENSSRTKTHISNLKQMSVSSFGNPPRVISKNKSNWCHYCKKFFSTKSNLNRHVKMHKQKKKFLEQKNNNSKRKDDNLYTNRKSLEPIRSQVQIIFTDYQHQCQHCGMWFTRKLDLSKHLKLHSQKHTQLEQVNTMNSSSVTDFITDASGSCQNIKNENMNKAPHICRLCGRLFARRINLCQHERVCHRRQIVHKQNSENNSRTKTHNSNSENVSISSVGNPLGAVSENKFNCCHYCNKFFSTKSNLNRHVKMHKQKTKFLQQKNNNSKRTDDNLYTKRKSLESIRNQVQIIFTDNQHQCQHCGKWFTRKLDLSQHLKLHSQKCTQLEQQNTSNSSLSVLTDFHTDTLESGKTIKKEDINKTPHICRFCGRLFARRINLCQHERVCHRRQILHKQNSENSSRTKTHNSNSKNVSISSVGNPLGAMSKNKSNWCHYCKKFFSTKSNLNRHVKMHKQKKKFFKQKNSNSKRTDDKIYTKRTSVESIRNKVHISSTHNLHQCQHCGKWFTRKLDLSKHLKLHSQKHTQMVQVNTMNSSSSVTDFITDTSELGQNIKKENTNNKPHICRFCGRPFARRINLCQHEKWHKQKDGNVFKDAMHICKICGRHFERRVNLCQHERWHSQKSGHLYRQRMIGSKPFQAKRKNKCRVCNKTCTNKPDLLLHYESRHTENLKCQVCNTLLGSYVHLRKHMRTHVEFSLVDMNELSHRKRAKYTNAAHFHRMTNIGKSHKVTKSKKYKCAVCGMSFNTHSLLFLHKKKHMMSEHACFVCGKIFTRKFDLARHLRIHTGDQPYECDICLKGFGCRLNLADHMGTHVLKEANEFQCDGCKALFFDQQSILNHLESTHTSHHKVGHMGTQIIHNDNELQGNELTSGRENISSDGTINYIQSTKPIFSCGICGEAYEEASHLYLHMGNHVIESLETENGKETGLTVKAESCSPNRQMESYQHLCKLENHLSHNDMQNSQHRVCLSDFVDTIKNETVKIEVSSLDGKGNTFDDATESLSDGYTGAGIDDTVDPSESVSEFPNVKHNSDMDERTISVESNVANFLDINKILDCAELNKTFKCSMCMHMFSSKHGLSQHKRWHARTNVKKDYCCVCKIYFSSKSSFKLHLNWHKSGLANKVDLSDKISIPLRPYRCEKCGKTFTRKDSLAKHRCMRLKGVKKSVVPNGFKCEICGCSYAQRACLVQHLLHKHNLAEKHFEAVCDEKVFSNEHAMNLHEKTKHCTNHKTSKKSNKKQFLVNAKSYSCTNLTEAVSPAGVGSDIFSSPLPRQYDEIALEQAYHETFIPKTHDITNCRNDQGKMVASNLGSLDTFPVSIKQEPVDLCDNSVCGSTRTIPVKELENGNVHNFDFDTSLQDSPFLNRVGSDATKFESSPSVQLNENVEQDDIQRGFEDPDQDEVDIDDIHDRNSSPIDSSNMLYFVRSTSETGQNDGLALLKDIFEKPSYSEAQLRHKTPPGLVKAAFVNDMKDFDERQKSTELPITQMESLNKNDNSHSCKHPNNSENSANDAGMEYLLEASKNTPQYLKQTEDVLRKDTSEHSPSQKHQIVEDHEPTTSGINQKSKEQQMRCIICTKMVYSQHFVSHLQSHADLKLYECKHCDECFLSAMSYSEHMEKNYGEIVCSACGETFTEKQDLIMHVRKHNFDVVLKCSICGSVFTCHDTFLRHLEFHVISKAKSAETQTDDSDGSRDIEIISTEDREEEEEEEENLRTLLEAQGDADVTLSSVITSSLADWKQKSMTLLSEGSIEVARRDDSATKIIDDPGKLFGNFEDPASSEDNEAPDIKPDINKLHDVMLMQNAYNNMETIMRHKQSILDRMVKKSPCQVRAEPQNTVSENPSNWYSKWKKLSEKITGSEHAHLYDRCQKGQYLTAPSTSSNRFPIRTELREPEKVPVIKKEFFEQDTQLLIEESERPQTTVRTGLKPCYVKLEKINYKILTCVFCLRILATENALKRHYMLHLFQGHTFS